MISLGPVVASRTSTPGRIYREPYKRGETLQTLPSQTEGESPVSSSICDELDTPYLADVLDLHHVPVFSVLWGLCLDSVPSIFVTLLFIILIRGGCP